MHKQDNREEIREAITLENHGKKIFGILHRPLETYTKVPAVVICPGFAGTKTGKFRLFVTLGKELAKRGIAVFRFDYRGSGDSEGEFDEITLESKISDTLKCLEFVAGDPQIDKNHLGLLGRSLGGVVALLSARRYHSIKSLALWAPVFKSDPWKELWKAFKSDQLDASKREMLRNLPANIPNIEFLNQFFSINLNEELRELQQIPLLHLHGMKDRIVEIEHARDFEKARENISNTRFVELPRSDHDFSDPEEQKVVIQETVKWFQQTLRQ